MARRISFPKDQFPQIGVRITKEALDRLNTYCRAESVTGLTIITQSRVVNDLILKHVPDVTTKTVGSERPRRVKAAS